MSLSRPLVLAALLALAAPPAHSASRQRAWLSIPRLGLDHVPLKRQVGAELLSQAEGNHQRRMRPLVIRLREPWLYTLQTPRRHERPRPFPGDEIQIVVGPRSRYKPALRLYVQQVMTAPRRALHRVLAHLSRAQRARAGLVLIRCWGTCTIVLAHQHAHRKKT